MLSVVLNETMSNVSKNKISINVAIVEVQWQYLRAFGLAFKAWTYQGKDDTFKAHVPIGSKTTKNNVSAFYEWFLAR